VGNRSSLVTKCGFPSSRVTLLRMLFRARSRLRGDHPVISSKPVYEGSTHLLSLAKSR
jgi:hypothetical protein